MTVWDHIKNITTKKGPYLGDEGWSNWLINKILSMDPNYCELVDIIQKNTWAMSGENLYRVYRDLIPKQYVSLKYIKNTNKKEHKPEDVEDVSSYYNVSKKRAKEYIELLSEDELKEIKQQIHGKTN